MNTLVFPVKEARSNVVLSGNGPALHVDTAAPSRILVVTKSKTQPVKVAGHTDINFAA